MCDLNRLALRPERMEQPLLARCDNAPSTPSRSSVPGTAEVMGSRSPQLAQIDAIPTPQDSTTFP